MSFSILTLKQSLLSQRELCQQESDRRHQLEAQLQNASAATLNTSEQVQALQAQLASLEEQQRALQASKVDALNKLAES